MRRIILSLVVFFIAVSISFSQTYTIHSLATVVSPLSVTSTDLNFGMVLKGAEKSIAPNNSNSGRWIITGTPNKNITLDVYADSYLVSSGNELTYSCSSTDLKYSTTDQTGATGTTFNPLTPTTATLSAEGKIFVFIGGKVQPIASQQPGAYSGNITLTIQYAGN